MADLITSTHKPQIGDPILYVGPSLTPEGSKVAFCERTIDEAISRVSTSVGSWIQSFPSNEPILVVAVMRGGKFFADKLSGRLSELGIYHDRAEIRVASRDGDGNELPEVQVTGDLDALRDRRVLFVDDVLDSGVTLEKLEEVSSGLTREHRSAVLVDKSHPTIIKRTEARYVGLHAFSSNWYGGAGMDIPGVDDKDSRGLPFIIEHKPLE